MSDYSVSELMTCVFAREMRDDDVGSLPGVRSEVPFASVCLGARMYAPNMYVHTTHGDTDPRTLQMTGTTSDYEGTLSSYQYHALSEYFDILHHGDVGFAFYGGLQVDKHANLNLNVIGDWHSPTVRGPGTAGGATENWAKRIFLWINEHSPRVFVERVDFVGVPGWDIDREALGIPGNGPDPIVTPLAVMDVDREVGRVRLRSVHPGTSVDEVVAQTGFELLIPDEVPETDPPSEKELRVLREEVDPLGILREQSQVG